MSSNQVVVQGVLKADGTLELSQPVPIRPGKVQVTLEPIADAVSAADPFWAAMDVIWGGQQARGHRCPSDAEIDSQLQALRDEAEEEMREIERLHQER